MTGLRIEQLTVQYGHGPSLVRAVDRVSLDVPTGGTLGLVGESGCGKSTLARAIVGLAPVVSGSVRVDGIDCSSQRARDSRSFRRRVQMVFQDPYSSLNPRMTISDTLGEALKLGGRERYVTRSTDEEAKRLLGLVGLSSSAMRRYPHQFSGGQRQRIAIARALAVKPQIVITDEITSALDVSSQATILNLLRELQRELGLSYLFISHDLSVIRHVCDRVAVMYLGRVVEDADADALFSRPLHPYTQALLKAVPRLTDSREALILEGEIPDPLFPPRGCRFHPRCPIGPAHRTDRSICQDEDPQIAASSRQHLAACHFVEA